jgi:hypothetical protein
MKMTKPAVEVLLREYRCRCYFKDELVPYSDVLLEAANEIDRLRAAVSERTEEAAQKVEAGIVLCREGDEELFRDVAKSIRDLNKETI